MKTRHLIKTLCKQKIKTIFLSTLIALNGEVGTTFECISCGFESGIAENCLENNKLDF